MLSDLAPLNISHLPDRPVSRLAPTPSGFLHLGNAVNFLVTWAVVRSLGGELHLRIDDMDGIRFRQDVLEDIFSSLEWLGIDWDRGPSGPDAFKREYSLQLRREYYRDHLKRLREKNGKTFVCGCSRSLIKENSANGLYPGTCRGVPAGFVAGRHAIRLKVDDDARIFLEGRCIDLPQVFGDFVIWRKDDQPSYQLASLLEDESAGINLIVRGEDLLFSSAAQIYLARCFGFTTFPDASFLHHALILGGEGDKLSKSRGAYALKDMREAGTGPGAAFEFAATLLGIDTKTVASARDLKESVKRKLFGVK